MTNYCNCTAPEPEEVEPGQIYCMKCELEILRAEDPPEPDEDDFSTAPDLVPENTGDKYENSQCASQTGEPSYEFGIR